ncbi:MAG TPA: DUF4271 domain-containing protein [Chitinophagaceae bacterium]|nr:DUF4271 domain-containing protein [Chitinophagaceae bacterium]
MKHLYPLLFFICFYPADIFAQTDSTTGRRDSLQIDSLTPPPKKVRIQKPKAQIDSSIFKTDSLRIRDSLRILDSLRLVQQVADSVQKQMNAEKLPGQNLKDGDKKVFIGKEYLFYYLVFLLILFGLLRTVFAKYFYDLFRVFFKTTLKQRQTQEQLLQSPLPSVFMNGFFVLSAGLYASFLLQYFQLSIAENFWLQYLYCAVAIASIYIVKFIGLKITGWLFNVTTATDAYIFIVFIINKMLGVFLLPFLVFLAFTTDPLYSAAMIFSWFGIGLLLLYRFILSYGAIRKEVKLNSFHFFLYIIGFEVVPLLLIYKLLLLIF